MDSYNHSSTSICHTRKHHEKIRQKYKEIISTTSKNEEWAIFRDLYQYQGFWYYERFLEGTLLAQEHFKARPNDIILCATLGSGTSMLKALIFAILNRSNPNDQSANHSHSEVNIPCLETDTFFLQKQHVSSYPKLPLFATHIPYNSLPKSIIESKCKIVYMCRNPKDVLVALWRSLGVTSDPDRFPLGKAFELFCKGVSIHGPFWDHVLGYWEATMKHPEKVLFLTYETLEAETAFNVRRLAQFMGCPFSLDEERRGVVQKISANKTRLYRMKEGIEDHKDYLTKEMKDHIDKITAERFKDHGLMLG